MDCPVNDIIYDLETAQKLMKWQEQNVPSVGQHAPDFRLLNIGTDEEVSLKQFLNVSPTVLLFGSYT